MNDIGTKPIETERLLLRRITLEDADAMYLNWATDTRVTDYVMWNPHKNIEETKELIQNWISLYEQNSYFWLVTLKENQEAIGTISVVHESKKQKKCEIGYSYGFKYWNHGYAAEALKAVLHFLLEEVGFELVEGVHLVTNPASGCVMQKAGMKKEARLRKRYIDPFTNKREDIMVYSMMKEDYNEI